MDGPTNIKLALDLDKLKLMIRSGIEAIPVDKKHDSATLVLGDTGVGKSTLLSLLKGAELHVKVQGIKAVLDSSDKKALKIGHLKFSETSVPTKVVIDNEVYFDCPGFRDNKGEEHEISNSFFVQRLLDIYPRVRLLLLIDESHITEARADKLPRLLRSLLKSFGTFADVSPGVFLIINRAAPDQSLQDYLNELSNLSNLRGESGYLFEAEERNLLEHIVRNKRVFLMRAADKADKDKKFSADKESLIKQLHDLPSIKSRHIKNILSESAKLAIRDYLDQVADRSAAKLQVLCQEIRKEYIVRAQELDHSDAGPLTNLKQQVLSLLEELKKSDTKGLVEILQQSAPSHVILSFEEDFSAVMFFKDIYDKTTQYYSNVLNKIYAELSPLLARFDKDIVALQKEQQKRAEQLLKIAQLEQQKIDAAKAKTDLQNELEKLTSDMKQLHISLSQEQANRNSAEAEAAALKQKIASLDASYSQEQAGRASAESESTALKEKIAALDASFSQQHAGRTSAQAEAAALKEKVVSLETEVETLRRDAQQMSLEFSELLKEHSVASNKASKKSKYEAVDCPHFKNGGKCIHCIKKWKASLAQEQDV